MNQLQIRTHSARAIFQAKVFHKNNNNQILLFNNIEKDESLVMKTGTAFYYKPDNTTSTVMTKWAKQAMLIEDDMTEISDKRPQESQQERSAEPRTKKPRGMHVSQEDERTQPSTSSRK